MLRPAIQAPRQWPHWSHSSPRRILRQNCQASLHLYFSRHLNSYRVASLQRTLINRNLLSSGIRVGERKQCVKKEKYARCCACLRRERRGRAQAGGPAQSLLGRQKEWATRHPESGRTGAPRGAPESSGWHRIRFRPRGHDKGLSRKPSGSTGTSFL